jgi:hypothetical protein
MRRTILFVVAFLIFASTASLAAPPADLLKTKIEKAKVTHYDELQKLETNVSNLFDTAETAARKQGDKATLDQLKVARVSFDLAGTLPKGLPTTTTQKFNNASNTLTALYTQAVKEYTKAGMDDLAEAAQKELDQHKKGPGPRYFALVNKKTKLVLSAEKADGARGSPLVQEQQTGKPNQQWTFVATGDPLVYQIKNRASGNFVNIPGPAKDGSQIILWDGGGGTNNNIVPARNGFHYSFLFVDSKKFMAIADTTEAEGKPVIHKEKAESDEQFWALVPVKR